MCDITLICADETLFAPGIRYISSYLRNKGLTTRLIFLTEPLNQTLLKNLLEKIKSRFIGVSFMSLYENKAVTLIKFLKENTDGFIIAGGLGAFFNADEIIKYADTVCMGEGEKALYDFIKEYKNNPENIYNLKSFYFNKKSKIKNNPAYPEENIDNLPFQDYSFSGHYYSLNSRIIPLVPEERGFKIFPIISARYCPFNCSYCHNYKYKEIYGKTLKTRRHGDSYIVNQLTEILNKVKVEILWIQDDDFFERDIKDIKEFALLMKEKIKIPYFTLASPENFSGEKLKILIPSGLFQVIIGVQSASPEILKLYNRKNNLEKVKQINKSSAKYEKNVLIKYDFIIFNPMEKEEDIIKTIKFIQSLTPPFYVSLNTLTVFKGTRLYDTFKANKLKFDFSGSYHMSLYDRFYRLRKFPYNRYLNLILSLMMGDSSKSFIGFLPRFLAPWLVLKPVVMFFNYFKSLTDFLIYIAYKGFKGYHISKQKKEGDCLQLPLNLIENHKVSLNALGISNSCF